MRIGFTGPRDGVTGDFAGGTPKVREEEDRSGTWATIRYAGTRNVTVVVMAPWFVCASFLKSTNDVAWGLIGFDSLASYETYRARLKSDPEARENFARAQAKRFILREERSFVEVVDGTFGLPSTLKGGPRG